MIYLVLYATFCIGFAKINAWLIEKDKRIYHGINGAIHLLAAGAAWYFYNWQIGIAILFVARLFFDVSLNLFRDKSINYVSPKPKSIVDKIEKEIFGNNGYAPKIIYLMILITLIRI